MHDPDVVAFTIVRPWPARTGLPAAAEGVRWRVLLRHEHHDGCPALGCTGNPLPWWRPRSWSRFWRLAGRDFFWPPLVTIWHREPGGADSGTVCKHSRSVFDEPARKWRHRPVRSWRWHVRHWRIQVHPAQHARRWLLTRCEGCGGRSRNARPVNVSLSWDQPPGRWWRGEAGLYHSECSRARLSNGRRPS
ncbi:MAG: hypothetical protein M0030_31280 [Actinomycetota bacterium]|nr:hypothetical protein [Actinomycetota bacterium]